MQKQNDSKQTSENKPSETKLEGAKQTAALASTQFAAEGASSPGLKKDAPPASKSPAEEATQVAQEGKSALSQNDNLTKPAATNPTQASSTDATQASGTSDDTGGAKLHSGAVSRTGNMRALSNYDPDYEFGPGAHVGEYIAEKKIGEGGMGEVWLGNHPLIGKRVAIKLLNRDFVANKEVVTRFIQEARAVNEIRHRNLVDIFSFGDLPDGRPYFVMEFLDGKPLSKYIKSRGPMPLGEIVDVFGQACRALQAAHDRGIIHRDLKPDNLYLILEEGATPFLKVLDFGIAKLAGGSGGEEGKHLTRTGAIFGTPAYMSPEQCEGAKAVDHRSDIYALGIILFEMLTGRTPFSEPGEGIGTIMMKQMSLPAPPPSTYVEGRVIPPEVDALVLRVLSKNPEERPQRCMDLFQELATAVGKHKLETYEDIKGAKPIFGPKQSIGEQLKRVKTGQHPVVNEAQNNTRPGDYYAGASQTGQDLQPVPPASNRVAVIGIAAALVLALGLGLSYLFLFPKSSPSDTSVPKPIAANNPPPSLPVPENPATQETPVTEPTVEPPKAPEVVLLTVISRPKGAQVYLDDELLGETPLKKEIPYGEKEVSLRIEKNGYEIKEEVFTPNAAYVFEPELKKARPASTKLPGNKNGGETTKENNTSKPPNNQSQTGNTNTGTGTNVPDKDATLNPFKRKSQ